MQRQSKATHSIRYFARYFSVGRRQYLNDILLPQFQQAFTLTNFQAGLIQSTPFISGYFVIPIPARFDEKTQL